MITNFDEIISLAREKGPKTLTVAVAQDPEVLLAVKRAQELGLINALLIGDKEEIRKIAEDIQLEIDEAAIIEQPDKTEACRLAVKLVANGEAHFVMKGLVDTSILFKAMLDKDIGLRTDNVLSQVTIAKLPDIDQLIYFTDSGLNIEQDLLTKKQLIENAVYVAHKLGNALPKVACICAVEKVNPKMKATLEAEQLVKMNEKGEINGCIVAGPFALDNALSLKAARRKGMTSPVAGQADILLMPSIEASNVFYKSVGVLMKAHMASIIAGTKAAVVVPSRADSTLVRLDSIALAVLLSSKDESAG
jgi:phosphate butyryltransferase